MGDQTAQERESLFVTRYSSPNEGWFNQTGPLLIVLRNEIYKLYKWFLDEPLKLDWKSLSCFYGMITGSMVQFLKYRAHRVMPCAF
jgi:hypothetical protein